jgi:hypothetical protein
VFQSLTTIISNPGAAFAVDPNGFIMTTGPALSPEQLDKVGKRTTLAFLSSVSTYVDNIGTHDPSLALKSLFD